MEGKRSALGFSVLPPMLIVFVLISAVPSSSLRDPLGGLQLGGNRLIRKDMHCCNECVCVKKWCVCSDRSRFGCFRDCGFCQCYDKPESTCYCVDVLHKCPPPCVRSPDAAAAGN